MADKNQSGAIYVSVNDTSRSNSTDSNRSSSGDSGSGPPSFVDELARKSHNGIEIGQSNGIDPRPPKKGSRSPIPGSAALSGDEGAHLINTVVSMPYHLPLYRKIAYGVGHVFNDMCASMWFTYLLVFFHFVVQLNNAYAGLLLLIGQIADAAATPIIGYLCDHTRTRYGRRKTWHLIGTVLVTISLFFFWHTCLPCTSSTPLALMIFYFAIPICIFQFGWASVQISHLSLIPELTDDASERVGLNAIRYAFTILSNVGVFAAMFILLEFVHVPSYHPAVVINASSTAVSNSTSTISPNDVWIFSGTALGIIAIGVGFAAFFHIFTREPTTSAQQREESKQGKKIPWYKWFTDPQFYTVALVYMSTRLIVNLTQVYTPLYLVDSLSLHKNSVAIGPLVIYVSGFLMTLLLKVVNKFIGRYMAYFVGLALVWGGLIWFWVQDPPHGNTTMNILLYGSTVLIGAGGSTLLVTSLSMVADLIGCTVGSSAFVYGLMSFTDKLSNGVTIQVIQALHPCRGKGDEVCCSGCSSYYRHALVYVPGGASMLALIGLAMLTVIIYWRSRECKDVSPVCPSPKDASASYAISRDIDSGYGAEGCGEKKPLLR